MYVMIRYYGELNRSQVESLVEIFHLDLLLFGYNAQVSHQNIDLLYFSGIIKLW